MIRLGVNVDHVATLRNARGEKYPDPLMAALIAQEAGADNITCHLREDRRHIKDRDLLVIKEALNIPLNFEMAATPEMISFAKKIKPHSVTLVPEKRQEITTEGGLNLVVFDERLKKQVSELKESNILVALFIEADLKVIEQAHALGADAIEIHTGHFCHLMAEAYTTENQWKLVTPFNDAAQFANEHKLQVHFGHGLNYHNAHWMQTIPLCEEANIGHAIISHAIFYGLERAIKEMKNLLNNPAYKPSSFF